MVTVPGVVAGPGEVPFRTVGEWSILSSKDYLVRHRSPFADVFVEADFTAPSGVTLTVPGFYDGGGIWRIRFNPGETGRWSYKIRSRPIDPELSASGDFNVSARETRGFLKATHWDSPQRRPTERIRQPRSSKPFRGHWPDRGPTTISFERRHSFPAEWCWSF